MESAITLQQEPRTAQYWFESLLDRDLIPDSLIRFGIRRLCAQRLRQEAKSPSRPGFTEQLSSGPIALVPDHANRQHYEVPARFFELVLGPRRKYSCALWEPGTADLAAAEEAMLSLYIKRAQLEDGQTILELGCGWGSLSLYLAALFPNSRIVGVSNSYSQRKYIEQQALQQGLRNLQIVTADMNDFRPSQFGFPEPFDRVISIEMFEHMRNYKELLRRISTWLTVDGSLFVHIFSHRRFSYPFDVRGRNDWMAEHFFTGGMMPSRNLLGRFKEHLHIQEQWETGGQHYRETCEAWLRNMDHHRKEIEALFRTTYGEGEELRWIVRWRVFFMACSELFGYRHGRDWLVSQYRLVKS